MGLRGAISGFGEVAAQAHLVGWQTRPDISIVAVHDPVAAGRHRAINLIRNVRVYDSLELMLDGEALDFIDIASPPAFHAQSARMALGSGVHVLVEKPLCLGLEEFDEIASVASRSDRVFMCVHNWKHAPVYRRAHELIASGRLGKLRFASIDRLRTEPAGGGGTTGLGGERWRLDQKTGGGILIDHGWHVSYLLQWLVGGLPAATVSALLGFRPGTELDDFADIRLTFGDELAARVHLSWRSPVRRTTAMVFGSEGLIELEDDRLMLTSRSGTTENHSTPDAPDDSYHSTWFAGVAAEFENALAQGAASAIVRENHAEARVALATILAARASAAKSGLAMPIG